MRQRYAKSFFLLLISAGFLFAMPATAAADNSQMLASVAQKLGITEEQATGAVGAVFDYAKENLSAEDFSSIASGIPGMDSLLSAAPSGDSGSLLSQAGSMLGDSAGSAGGLASLAGSFESLGLDADMVNQLLPMVYDFVGNSSGSDALGLLQGLF